MRIWHIYQTVKARFWHWRSGKNRSTLGIDLGCSTASSTLSKPPQSACRSIQVLVPMGNWSFLFNNGSNSVRARSILILKFLRLNWDGERWVLECLQNEFGRLTHNWRKQASSEIHLLVEIWARLTYNPPMRDLGSAYTRSARLTLKCRLQIVVGLHTICSAHTQMPTTNWARLTHKSLMRAARQASSHVHLFSAHTQSPKCDVGSAYTQSAYAWCGAVSYTIRKHELGSAHTQPTNEFGRLTQNR